MFASFLADGNDATVAALTALAEGGGDVGAWLWGASAAGKSHLLQAACERFGDGAVFVPLAEFVASDPGIIEGVSSRALVCLDDIDCATGNTEWEQALFNLYNDMQQTASVLITSAAAPPRATPFALPDLQSRMSQLSIYQLQPLDDSRAASALQLRANHRGLDLPDETAQFLLKHSRRDMASLYALLDRLDDAAMRAQRRLTIPFVKTVLDSDSP